MSGPNQEYDPRADVTQGIVETISNDPLVVESMHSYDDTDSATSAHHHTLGPGPTQAAPGDHTHANSGLVLESTTPPQTISVTANTVGTAVTAAHSDHAHLLVNHNHSATPGQGGSLAGGATVSLESTTAPQQTAASSSVGTGSNASRSDHQHKLGDHLHSYSVGDGSLLNYSYGVANEYTYAPATPATPYITGTESLIGYGSPLQLSAQQNRRYAVRFSAHFVGPQASNAAQLNDIVQLVLRQSTTSAGVASGTQLVRVVPVGIFNYAGQQSLYYEFFNTTIQTLYFGVTARSLGPNNLQLYVAQGFPLQFWIEDIGGF